MSDRLKQVPRFIAGKDFPALLAITFLLFAAIERTGLFRSDPASFREIFHSGPSRVMGLLLALHALAALFMSLRSGAKLMPGLYLYCGGLLLLAGGLWVSIFTHFEGRTVVAEGETFNAFPGNYIRQSLVLPRSGRIPQVGITVMKIQPDPAADLKSLKALSADILYAGKTTSGVLNGRVSSPRPLISDWTIIRITDFGYAPRYVLSDLSGKQLESQQLYMKLFPPGAEEKFEAMFLGYLFYLRCYPDYYDDSGKPATRSALPKNPVFNLRIVRNKDILYDGLVAPSERVRFDNFVISVPEVKMWVEISLVRDPGLPVAAAGIILLTAGIMLTYRRGGYKKG